MTGDRPSGFILTSAVYGTDPVITRGINDSGIASQSASEELGKLCKCYAVSIVA